jgi:hypothetical protein
MFEIREKRKLGVSTSIDVSRYIAVSYVSTGKKDSRKDDNIKWKLLVSIMIGIWQKRYYQKY